MVTNRLPWAEKQAQVGLVDAALLWHDTVHVHSLMLGVACSGYTSCKDITACYITCSCR
jgi:hypothetical protein